MGLTNFLKKKIIDTPEKQIEREELKQHKLKVKQAYDKAYREAELTAATEKGNLEGAKAPITKKKGSLLSTIGNIAEGMVYGVNKGADAFNKGVGLQDFNLEVPKQTDQLIIPQGNNDLFYDSNRLRTHRKKRTNELFESY
jgi:hypothetical protein